MGITITNSNSNKKATLKLLSHLCTYLFEEQYGELKGVKESDLKKLQSAQKVLSKIAK